MKKIALGLAAVIAMLGFGGLAQAQTAYPAYSHETAVHSAVQSALQHDGAAGRNCMPPGLPPNGIGAMPPSNTTCQ